MHSPGKETNAQSDLSRPATQSLQTETDKNGSRDQVYSVPIDVLQTISKDFNHLESEFDKSTEEFKKPIENQEKRNEDWANSRENNKNNVEGRKTLRIKSIRTIKTNSAGSSSTLPQLEEAPPPGTVARVEIKTDRARNKTIFTILPALGGWWKGSSIGEPHSFSVNTCNLAKATKLIKPLHLQKLPILRDILETSIKAAGNLPTNKKSETEFDGKLNSIDPTSTSPEIPFSCSGQERKFTPTTPFAIPVSRNNHDNPIELTKQHGCSNDADQLLGNSGYKHVKKVEESEFLRELEKYGLHYDMISRSESSCDSRKEAKGSKLNWACPENGCHKSFPKLSKLKIHIFSHRNIRPFKCQKPGCSWAFHTAFKLKRHENTAHADKEQKLKYECKLDKCIEKVKSFSSPYNLNQHLKRHARPLDFKCPAPGCEAAFQTNMELKSHLKSSIHRSLILQNLENVSGSNELEERLIMLPEHICHTCGKRFFNSKDLLVHVNQFHAESDQHLSSCKAKKYKYRCTFEKCEKAFDLPSRLAAHARTHTGERPYPCSWPSCCWSFRTASKLRRHERTHKNDRKYICSICSKSYFRPEHLKSHMLAIHNPSGSPERFVCPLNKCTKKFSARSTLYVHMKRHAGEQRVGSDHCSSLFRCVIESCDDKFYDRNELRRHVSLNHVQELAESTAAFHNDETNKKTSLLNESQLNIVPTDQETVTATAELDFIALLSSVGDEDALNSSTAGVESNKIDNVDSINEQLPISENHPCQTVMNNTENKAYFQNNQPTHQDEKSKYQASVTETEISEDQIISEMIIETLTSSTSEQSVKMEEHEKEPKVTSCSKYDEEKIELETLSTFLSKDSKQQKNSSNVPSVFIAPFSNEVKQSSPQSELITVDASAITPIKVITQHDTRKTSISIGHESHTDTIPIPSNLKEDIIIDQFSQVQGSNRTVQLSKNRLSKIELDLDVPVHPPPSSSETSIKMLASNLSSKNSTVTSKEKRPLKKVSVLKSKQSKHLHQTSTKVQIKKDCYIASMPIVKPDKSKLSTTSISERKRPSILRRSKSTVPFPSSCNSDVSNEQPSREPHYHNPLRIQELAETVICKKRAPKKQKLLKSLQEN